MTPEEIWKKTASKLPPMNEEERKLAKEQWMLQKLKNEQLSPQEEVEIAMRSIFDNGFYQKVQQTLPAEKTQAKRISLVQWSKWASAAAAVILLAFGLSWAMDDSQVYAAALASIEQKPSEASYLGATYEVYPNLCDLQPQLAALAQQGQGIAIPEQTAIVTNTGTSNGCAFYDITQNNCEMRVLTKDTLPEIGETVSFNAQASMAQHFGREIVLLVEVVRHEVY